MASRTLRRRSSYRAINRHANKRSHPIVRLLIILLVGFTMLTSGASAATIFFYGNNLPTLKNFTSRFQYQNTLIRDSQGNVLYDMADVSKGRGKRVVEPLVAPQHRTVYYRQHNEYWLTGPRGRGIPVVLQDATIATEDSTFYSNPGFDPLSIIRAGYDNLTTGHIVSGASTITQQLVREYMLNTAPTLSRKGEEILLAAELTQKYDKSKILWYYLNSVPYGNLSYGAEAAAKQYFNTDVWHLDLAQSALIAGLPEAPSTYNPVNNLPGALGRMQYVLHLMYVHGYLKDAQGHPDPALITQAMNEAHTWKHFQPAVTLKKYPHFVQYAIDQLATLPQVNQLIHNGLDVWTTLDPRLQDVAQRTVTGQINQLGAYHVTDGALVSLNLRTGCRACVFGGVMAMVGSADYNNKAIAGQINMADEPRQPGSSFKPFNYVLAFQNHLSPGTSVLDAPLAIPDQGNPQDGGWYEPTDYDLMWHGAVTLRTALANSLNVPAVKVEQYNASLSQDGTRAVAEQAIKMGITSLFKDNPHCCGWALTLGGMERGVRLVQETAGYGTFGTSGKLVQPVAIWRVYDRTTHKLLYDATNPKDNPNQGTPGHSTQVVDPAYTYLMSNVLSDNNSRCTPTVCEFGLDSPLNLGRTAAAKTGTTNAFTDNWTLGYTPDIVTGVWVGNADNSPMVGTTGITGAAPIWHDYMLNAFNILRLPPKDFVEPPGVYFGTACRIPGPYWSQSYMGGDLFAGGIPLCSVGTYNTNLPVPQNLTNTQPAVPSQPAVQPPAAPAPAAAPAAPVQSAPNTQTGVQAASPPVTQNASPPTQNIQAPLQQQAQPPVQQQAPAASQQALAPNGAAQAPIPGAQPSP